MINDIILAMFIIYIDYIVILII